MNKLFIKYTTTGKIYQFSGKEDFNIGEKVLIDTEQGIVVGLVCLSSDKNIEKSEDKILRKMNEKDKEKLENFMEKEKEAKDFCQKQIDKLKLSMKLVQAEYSLDEKKLTFYFIAEDRVDFRELLSSLISHFHRHIRLQQLGPRDAAKIMGGIGPCGRILCCQSFLENTFSVTLEMAKQQDLAALGSSKISGACGKLMCCLTYEVEIYEKLRKKLPAIDSIIETEKGKGKVLGQSVLKQSVLVQLEDGTKTEIRNPKSEIRNKS